jgi:hypothetical protein
VNLINGTEVPWDPDADDGSSIFSRSNVRSVVFNGNIMFCAGTLLATGGVVRTVAAVDFTTGQTLPWSPEVTPVSWPGSDASVQVVSVSGANVFVGGTFIAANAQTRKNLAACSVETGELLPWSANVANFDGGRVRTMAATNDTIYVGGDFLYAGATNLNSGFWNGGGAQPRNYLVAFDAESGAITPWNPNPNAQVYALLAVSTNIYAGGDFSLVGTNVPRNFLAAFDHEDGRPTSWNPNADDLVRCLAADGSTIYAGGFFMSVNSGVPRRGLAAFDLEGHATPFNPQVDRLRS